jgi:hypothetical protein
MTESLTSLLSRTGVVLAMLTASVLLPARALGQQWKCVAPTECGVIVPTGSTAAFALRLELTPSRVGAGVPVAIKTSDGVVFVNGVPGTPDDQGLVRVRTDSRGMLEGYVQGAKSGQEIHVDAEFRDRFVTQTLRVVRPVPLSSADKPFVRYAGTQAWDVSVYANGLDEEACRRSVVRFTARGGTGSVSKDSAYGDFEQTRNGTVCAYSTDWRLGNEVGRQVLLARAGSAPPFEINALARRKPALRVGLGMALRRGEVATVQSSRAVEKIRVRRTDERGYIEYDSIPRGDTVKTSPSWQPEAMPLILLDGPVGLKWHRLRVSVGASAINVRRDFFVGVGILQMFKGVQVEDNGFDVQFGALMSRPERLRNPALCDRDLEALRPQSEIDVSCDTRNGLRFDGVVATVSTDAQGLIGAVGKMLGF